jgi:hypothetical protein
VLAERPGVSASDLASASGAARTVLYALLKRLEQSGEVAREQMPGGTTGYRLATARRGPPRDRTGSAREQLSMARVTDQAARGS